MKSRSQESLSTPDTGPCTEGSTPNHFRPDQAENEVTAARDSHAFRSGLSRCFGYSSRHSHGDAGRGAALLCFRTTPIFRKPAHLLRNSHAPPSHSVLRYYYMMVQGTQQTGEDSPRFTIDCVLPLASTQLQADGCVLESLEDGHKLITPDYLRAGDLVKVQLWLEGEEAFIDISLAVVSKVHTPWITVGVIRVSPTDRLRLKRFIQIPAAMPIGKPAHIDHLLIRA